MAAAADDLMFGDVDLDGWDVGDLPAGAVHFGRAGQVRSAPVTAGRFVAAHHIGVGDLLEGLAAVPVLSAGLALGQFAQRPGRCRRAVGGWGFGRVLRVGPQLRFQVGDPHFQRSVLGAEEVQLGAHFDDQIHQFCVRRLRHSNIIAFGDAIVRRQADAAQPTTKCI